MCWFSLLNQRAHSIGVVVREISNDTITAADNVTANSRNKRPTTPPINKIGKNTATSDTLIASTVKPTSLVAFNAALNGCKPFSTWRLAFSNTTIASSTTKPVDMVNAINDKLLMLNPQKYINAQAPNSDTGTATIGTSVERTSRKNTSTTKITNAIAINKLYSTSSIDERIASERSTTTDNSMVLGIDARNSGNTALTCSTVCITLASGCFLRIISTEGSPFFSPVLRKSSTESSTVPKSLILTAAPLR